MKNLLFLFILNSFYCASAQEWSFKKFNKQVENKIKLHYSIDELWLFENEGRWGIYNQSKSAQMVPPLYDLVLPTLNADIFYVTKGDFVGLFSLNGGELLPPNRFENLKLLSSESGELFVRNEKKIYQEEYGYTTIHTEYTDYSLNTSSDDTWSVVKTNARFRIQSETNLHEDGLEQFKDHWKHRHGHLEIEMIEMDGFAKPGYILTNTIQQSSIISRDRKYLIPPRYFGIRDRGSFIEVMTAKPQSEEPSQNINFTKKGLFTPGYMKVIAPIDGYVGDIWTGGYYAHTDSSELRIFDNVGSIVFVIPDFKEYIEYITLHKEKYYIACNSMDGMEMSIYDQHIYTMSGDFINMVPLSFFYLEGAGIIVPVEKIDPDGDYDLVYGLFDLNKSMMVGEASYDDATHRDYKNTLTLTTIEDQDCKYYSDMVKDGVHFYFNCKGDTISVTDLDVNGRDYQIVAAEKESSRMDFHESPTSPFIHTHVIYYSPPDDYYGYGPGLAAVIEMEYQGLAIFKIYSEYSNDIAYGLAYPDEDQMILAPVFEKIVFDKEGKYLKLIYNSKEYIFSLDRYEK